MEALHSLTKNNLIVLAAKHAARDQATELAAQLALSGSVTVLDNGNRFQPYELARAIRKLTRDVERTAGRVFIRRAFTCYQTLALLESTPSLSAPYLILDFLANFYDENITEKEIARVYNACTREVLRLKHGAPVVVTLAPPRLEQRGYLLERVYALAEKVIVELPESPLAAHHQLDFFSGGEIL